jgi:hypothetical protein
MTSEHERLAPVPEPDHVSGRGALRIAVAGLVVFVVAVVIAAWLLRRDVVALAGTRRPVPPASAVPLGQRGRPEVTQVRAVAAGWQRREAAQRRLHAYGWNDRTRRVVHIPIERAMELVAGEGVR